MTVLLIHVITRLLRHNLLDLMTVLLIHVITRLLRLVGADQPLLGVAQGLDGFLLALITDLPELLLAVLGVAVLLGLFGASLHLKFANLLGLEVTILLLDWKGEDVGKLLAVPVNVSLADLHLDLSGDVVAALSWFPMTHDTLKSIPIVLGTLVPLTIELHGVSTGNIVYHLLFHVAVGSLHVGALVVILSCHVDLIGGVAHPVLPSEASLPLVGFL